MDGIIGMDFLTESSALLDSASRLLYVGQPSISIDGPRGASGSPVVRAVPLPLTLKW